MWQMHRVMVPHSRFAHALLAATLLLFAGCASSGHYHGYKCRPYVTRGIYYQPLAPRQAIGYSEVGVASCYSEGFFIFPGKTALGEPIYGWTSGAAHKTLPLPCRVRITNLRNGRSMTVRVNDRGPFVGGRIIDVTYPVAKRLGFYQQGTTLVKIRVLSVGDGRYRIR